MTETTNYRLKKPATTDFYNVEDFNANADKIDAVLAGKAGLPILQTITLDDTAWTDGGMQTVEVAGVLPDETLQLISCAPAAASRAAWDSAGVQCVGQGDGTLLFSCLTVPEAAIEVLVTTQEVLAV